MNKLIFALVAGLTIPLLYFIFLPKPEVKSEPIIPSIAPSITIPPKQIKLGLVGDLGLGRYITSLARSKNDFNYSFDGVSSWLLDHNLIVANLESPIIHDCPTGNTGTFTFCGDTKFIPVLEKYPFVFNLNNNHILNYGSKGLLETQALLKDVPHFYDNFYTITVDGINLGFLGFDFVTYPNLDKKIVIEKIKKFSPQVDHLVVSVHWGNEYLPKPELWRVTLAHQMIDAGASIVHGHHPHVWQGYEIYHDRLIFYSFGNFVFDQSWSYDTSHSQIATLLISKNNLRLSSLTPVTITNNSRPIITKDN